MAEKKQPLGALAKPFSGATRSRSTISTEDAKELLALYKTNGSFTIPVEDFNKRIGMDDNTARAWQIKRMLNKMHFDLIDNLKEWRVGQTQQNTLYVFGIRTKKED